MAMPTTTVEGKVILPDGNAATAGTIYIELNQPGKVNDGATDHRAGGKYEADIGADGSVDFALIPNDAITRDGQGAVGGTYYKANFIIETPFRAKWSEYWSVTSAPDPVDLGAINRVTPNQPAWSGVSGDAITVLPTPDADWYKRIAVVEGGAGVADLVFICLKNASDAYYWHFWTAADSF